jgi:N-acetylglutamate synthase-like GNAT family acetyltransferase
MMLAFRPLRRDSMDFAAFVGALSIAGLPTNDLGHGGRYYAFDDDHLLVGFGGLEGSGPDQMIRSVVIPLRLQGRGYGQAVVDGLVRQAVEEGVERLWLLTTSADPFFSRVGWRAEERASAPDAVRTSRQFSGLCPASAVLMCRHLA